MAKYTSRAICVSLAAALGCGATTTPPQGSDPAFLHAEGTAIVDADGHPIFLKGISLGNQVWSDVALPGDHGEIDFARLAAMGANSTRFLLNYKTFEDDAAPGVYKDAGWRWIDQNIAWARANRMYLILNMHVPPGGFQSDGEGGALWTDPRNQDRLTALWTAIARRYAAEPAIAGFGLLNEPEPTAERRQWRELAERLAAAIRSVDANHLLFVERPIAIAGNFKDIDADLNLFTIDDPNTVYEFHFYDPSEYAFQLQPWNHTPDGGTYPDPDRIGGVTEQWLDLATFDAPTAPAGTSGWTHYEGTRITASSAAIAVGKPALVGQAIGTGTIAFDDLTISEFDPGGVFTREVAHVLPSAIADWYFWSSDGSGVAATTSACKTSATCLTISATTGDANLGGSRFYFVPKPGYQYSVSGWMRGTALPAGATARIRLDLLGSSTPVAARTRAWLTERMTRYFAWSQAHDVPLFLGEFGVYRACFAGDKGGLTWVRDVYELATSGSQRVAALSYHQYHEESFALYYGTGPVDLANANQPLIDLLASKLRAAP
jgi:endoglucanase